MGSYRVFIWSSFAWSGQLLANPGRGALVIDEGARRHVRRGAGDDLPQRAPAAEEGDGDHAGEKRGDDAGSKRAKSHSWGTKMVEPLKASLLVHLLNLRRHWISVAFKSRFVASDQLARN
jgi:hypothetical protein